MVPYIYEFTAKVTNVKITHQPLSPSVGGGWSAFHFP